MSRRGARFVRFYPSDWRSGCIGLSLEQQGLYIAICAYIYETGKRVPLADSVAAKILMVQVQKYTKILQSLIEAGKISTHENGHTVGRAERELLKAQGATAIDAAGSQAAVERRIDQGLEGAPSTHPLAPPPYAPPPSPTGGEAEKTQCFLRATKEPVTSSQDSITPFIPQADAERVKFEKGELRLSGTLRSFWVEQFSGDEARLDLALIQAAGYVQPNSFRPLEAQVGAQLARIAGAKRESDQRYAGAVKARESAPANGRSDFAAERIARAKALMIKPKLEVVQ